MTADRATWFQSEAAAQCDRLTPREREVLVLRCKGLSVKSVARSLGVEFCTADDHCKALRRKLAVRSMVEAAVIATKAGLV